MNPAMNAQPKITPMYPGIQQSETDDGPDLPKAPLNTLLGFDLETYQIPLDTLMPSKRIPDGVMSTRKYKQVVSSIHEIGLIEPLSVIQHDPSKSEFILLDGHLRVLALKDLGVHEAPCLLAKDDETYTYNHRINRLSTIQEHYMIRRAIDRGVSKERLARAFGVNLSSINRRINLLEGICPDAIARLQDKQFTPDVTRVLRNMKAARQVEAVELMVASNTITVAHADALLKATPPEQRTDFKPTERDKQLAPIEQIVKLEKEMNQVQVLYRDAEENYGSDLLNLVVAKGYLTKLLGNEAVKSYITRHEPEILEQFELVVNTVSMEEAVQQQLEADGEFEDDPENNDQPAAENMAPDPENGNETQEQEGNPATE
jgi:ParB-like chromosome segregation protein Spo0J